MRLIVKVKASRIVSFLQLFPSDCITLYTDSQIEKETLLYLDPLVGYVRYSAMLTMLAENL